MLSNIKKLHMVQYNKVTNSNFPHSKPAENL